jgi:hypothetical protein
MAAADDGRLPTRSSLTTSKFDVATDDDTVTLEGELVAKAGRVIFVYESDGSVVAYDVGIPVAPVETGRLDGLPPPWDIWPRPNSGHATNDLLAYVSQIDGAAHVTLVSHDSGRGLKLVRTFRHDGAKALLIDGDMLWIGQWASIYSIFGRLWGYSLRDAQHLMSRDFRSPIIDVVPIDGDHLLLGAEGNSHALVSIADPQVPYGVISGDHVGQMFLGQSGSRVYFGTWGTAGGDAWKEVGRAVAVAWDFTDPRNPVRAGCWPAAEWTPLSGAADAQHLVIDGRYDSSLGIYDLRGASPVRLGSRPGTRPLYVDDGFLFSRGEEPGTSLVQRLDRRWLYLFLPRLDR